ncbi:hypothetical protein [Capillimicrobium parvum]|uniref:Lipoprotein n=1 Tax=Capillimicrobium parvum TaxID=2884022 RepID=A0A9E6XV34_9ACTN|nr:hypothetical protein [Capillimicrobium parvum]UGS35015.1 hypothetical protein DSM104329_01399 [Capillimicrobium parvum]
MPTRRSARAATFTVLAALVVAAVGCGAEPPDLFAVDRSGSIAGAKLRLEVNDGGTVRCNGGEPKRMPSKLLLDARELQRQLDEPGVAGRSLPPGPTSVLRYDVRTEHTRVRFADDSRNRPKTLDELAFLVRQVAQEACGLAR